MVNKKIMSNTKPESRKKKYYHYTQKSNISSIMSSEKLECNGFGVYVCSSLREVLRFLNFYIDCNIIKREDVVVMEFKSIANFEESFDHDPRYFDGAKALVCWDTVAISNIKIRSINEL